MLHRMSCKPGSQMDVNETEICLPNQNRQEDPVEVLREIHRLLEDYSPMWYSETLHARTANILSAFSAR